MAGHSRKKGEAAFVAAIVTGGTVEAAAQTAGIGERTAYTWLARPEIRQQISEARGQLVEQACGRLADAATAAADALCGLLAAKSESVRLSAARALLELAFRARETLDHEERLTALEEAAHD
jgi:phage terminase small subunit